MNRHLSIVAGVLVCLATVSTAVSIAPAPSIETRVAAAETVFIGKLINRMEIEGGWVHAELQVTQPLLNAKQGEKIPVIWREIRFRGKPVFDAAEGREAIAILNDRHEGRYWLRDDKFLNVEQVEEVRRAVAARLRHGTP